MATTRFADHLLTGDHASRPAANAVPVGTLYSCTTHSLIYQSDGASWSTYATLGGTETLPESIIDAKGDLIAGTAADTAVALGVGTDGDVLTADSGATEGVSWQTPGGGGGAWTQLYDLSLGVAGTFDQASISGAYNDLVLVLIARDAAASTIDVWTRFNNDTGSNYGALRGTAVSGSMSVGDQTGSTRIECGRIPGTGSTANSFARVMITIPGYASTSLLKTCLIDSSFVTATSSGGIGRQIGSGFWNSTAAINRVQIAGASGGNLLAGSKLRIYGVL